MTRAHKKNGVWVVYDSFEVDHYDFGGTADQLKANIDLVVEKAKSLGMVGEGRFEINLRSGWYDDNCDIAIEYTFDRLENDKERAKREKAEAKVKATAKAKRDEAAAKRKLKADAEFAEYERLKAKFKGM